MLKQLTREKVSSYRAKGKKRTSSYTRDVDRQIKKVTHTIPTDVDDKALDLLIENMEIHKKIIRLTNELPQSVLDPVGSPKRITQLAKIKEIKKLKREQRKIGNQITKIWDDLSQPQKSATMREFNKRIPTIK